MGFFTKVFGGADGIRETMRESYEKHVRMASEKGTEADSILGAGLFGALGSRYMARRQPFNEVQLWAELAPFLLMPEQEAIAMLAEYVVHQEMPHAARIGELSLALSRSLEGPTDDYRRQMAVFAFLQGAPWSSLIDPATAAHLRDAAQDMFEDGDPDSHT